MSRRQYDLDFSADRKLLVGEGESDRNFFAHLCRKHSIDGFQFAFTGMQDATYKRSGFSEFGNFLSRLPLQRSFENITDIVLVCDATEKRDAQFKALCQQVAAAQGDGASGTFKFSPPSAQNAVSAGEPLRVHALVIPFDTDGGLETLCLQAAIQAAGEDGAGPVKCVETFAACATDKWTAEKRDKLRLNALVSAMHRKKPEMHFYHVFDMMGDTFIPLDSPVFEPLVAFLKKVQAL